MISGVRFRALAAASLAVLALQACETPGAPTKPDGPIPNPPSIPTQPDPPNRRDRPEPPARPVPPSGAMLRPADLPGWGAEDHLAAFKAYQVGCGVQKTASDTCRRARLVAGPDANAARRFLEENFRAEPLPGEGILTAYFAPVYEARELPEGDFTAPVRPTPTDLRPGAVYADRAAIESRPPNGALAWMRAEDLFFLQVQGSGTLVYPDGRRLKAAFAAHNSRTFAGIANPMRDRGLLAANNTSGDAIRTWLADHRGPEADAVMRINPRYVFFKLSPDDDRDPAGAAGISLPAGHAIAIDPAFHEMGQLYWIDGQAPILAGAFPAYQRLVMALDTGGAIKGQVRADLYMGRGDAAGQEAGRVRHTLRMYRLVPLDDAIR